ncbi:MAG TPA: hypothetical protein VFO29_05490 [Candidatus Rubrimentiphilum sp.]|nr:hypothetical protein [Candidatus Rubrimentiphilum sp.]
MRAIFAASAIVMALLLPLAAHPSPDVSVPAVVGEGQPGANLRGSPWREKAVFVPRDPFLPGGAALRTPAAAVPSIDRSAHEAASGIALRAIAFGDNSRALVDIGGVTRIVGVGDAVGSLQVAFIGMDRIQLSDGETVTLEEEP